MIRTLVRLLAFTAVCIGFTLWLAFTIGNIQPFQDRYTLSATFDDVTGLIANDNVKISGVVVGKVTGIGVEKGKAVVDFEVNEEVALPRDTETGVRWRNLLGQRYLYLYPGDADENLEGGDHIPIEQARQIVDLGELFNQLGPIVDAVDPEAVNKFLVAVTGALKGGNDALLGETIGDLGTVVEALGSRDEAIARMITNLDILTEALTDRDRQLRSILDNLTDVAGTFAENTDVVERSVTELGDFSELLGRLIAENRPGIDRIITNLDQVVDLVADRLDSVEATVGSLDDLGLSLYNAARYGEWLNQFIACVVIDVDGPEGPIPPVEDTDLCTSESTSSTSRSSGGDAPSNPVVDVLTKAVGTD